MTTHSHTQNHKQAHPNKSPKPSLDSGVNIGDSLLNAELEETSYHEVDSLNINRQPEQWNTDVELPEKDLEGRCVNYSFTSSDADPGIPTVAQRNGFTSVITPKSRAPPSLLDTQQIPPPLPPKSQHRSPMLGSALGKGNGLESGPTGPGKGTMPQPMSSSPRQNFLLLGTTPLNPLPKGESLCLDPGSRGAQVMAAYNGNCMFATLARSAQRCVPQSPPKLPPNPPPKPPGLFSAMRSVTEEKHLEVSEPPLPRQIPALSTEEDKERDERGEEGKDWGKANEDANQFRLTTPIVTENSSQLGEEGSIPKSSVGQEVGRTGGGRVAPFAKPPRSRATPVLHTEIQIHSQSQDPGRQAQHSPGGDVHPGLLPRDAHVALINPPETDMEAVKRTDKEIQLSQNGGHNLIVEEEDGRSEDFTDQSSMKEMPSQNNLTEGTVKRQNTTSQSPFSSFKVSSINLVEELLSGKEWSQFLPINRSPSPPLSLNQSDPEETDVFDHNHPDTEEEPVYEYMDLPDTSIVAASQSNVRGQDVNSLNNRAAISAMPKIVLDSDVGQLSPRTQCVYNTVEFIPPLPADTHFHFSAVKSQGLLDNSIKKYCIKLSKRRKHRAPRLRHRRKGQENLSLSPSSQVFPTSTFYKIPTSGGEAEQHAPTVKSASSSPRSLAKLRTAMKDITKTRAAQPKEEREKK